MKPQQQPNNPQTPPTHPSKHQPHPLTIRNPVNSIISEPSNEYPDSDGNTAGEVDGNCEEKAEEGVVVAAAYAVV